MALSTVTTTFDLADYFGTDFDARRTKAWATTNAPDATIHDESTGETRIGAAYATIAADGTGSFSHWAPGASANPATWQTYYHFDVPDRSTQKGRRTLTLGPFTVTASGELTALVEEQIATPTATASDYAAAAGSSATDAAASESAAADSATAAATSAAAADADRIAAEAARDAAVDISGISTSDAVVEALVKNTGGAGPLTSAALTASFAGKGGDAGDALAPLFVSNYSIGLSVNTPANLQPDGTPIIAVTGTKGSKILTTTETAKVAGLGSNVFEAALNSTDGTNDIFVTVMSHNGSTQITLRDALDADFAGTLCSKYDAALGQHLTAGATRAYAQHIAKATGLLGSRGAILEGTWAARPGTYNTMWVKNAALTSYGVSNSAAPVVQSTLLIPVATNVLASGGLPIVPISLTKMGVQVGTHAAGHGADATLYAGREDVVLEFFTGCQRSSTNLNGVSQLTVTVKVDGRTVYSKTHDNALTAVRVPVSGGDKIDVSVTNADGGIYYIYLTQATLREAGVGGSPFSPTKKVVVLADSWGEYYSGALATTLAEKTGAKVINHSLSGQTSEWALSWFDTYVLAEKPDVVLFHFFTNDSNNLSAQTFIAPDGSTVAKWPSGLTDAQSQVRWRENMLLLAQRARQAGIKPVIVLPGGTASETQSQKHMEWSWMLDRPLFLEPSTTATELADATAYVNVVGKKQGTMARIGAARRFAAGPLAADTWGNVTDDALLPLQLATLKKSSFAMSTGVVIGTDSDANGLSDGLVEKTYGTGTGDVVTYSIVGGNQRTSMSYGTGTGNRRLGANFTAVSGKEYLAIFDIINGPAGAVMDAVSDITGSAVAFVSGSATLDGSGAKVAYYRGTANASATKYAALTTPRTNSTVKAWDLRALYIVDLTALLAAAPNWAAFTDAQIASYFLQLAA